MSMVASSFTYPMLQCSSSLYFLEVSLIRNLRHMDSKVSSLYILKKKKINYSECVSIKIKYVDLHLSI